MVGKVLAVGYHPEGTGLPPVTQWVMTLSPFTQSGQKRWDFDYHADMVFFIAVAWAVSMFVLVWWTCDRTVMTRRWIVVSSVVWSLISTWMLLVTTGLGAPLMPRTRAGMSMAPPVVESAAFDWWTVAKTAAYFSLVAVLVVAYRRDSKRRSG